MVLFWFSDMFYSFLVNFVVLGLSERPGLISFRLGKCVRGEDHAFLMFFGECSALLFELCPGPPPKLWPKLGNI